MNYIESIEYIHSVNWCFCKPGLERIEELCRRLGGPEKELKFVHVAGTNGKGSFCSMLSSILTEAGCKTGLFTSPYIRFFNERMQIDGTPISDGELAEITSYVRPIADSMTDKPTEFELITAICFEYFKRNKCDIVVLEAGMGGRLDSTNIIESPMLSVITGVALDHTAYLGDTVEKIAFEKAGIIKKKCPVLLGGEAKEAHSVIEARARETESEFFTVDYSRLKIKSATLDGTVFDFGHRKSMEIFMLGMYQPRNAAAVLTAVDILRGQGISVSETAVRAGLSAARWQARFEVISREPTVIFDGAHNAEGIDAAVESIKMYLAEQRVLVLTGVLADKDHAYIAKRLSEIAERAFVMTPDNMRALPSDEYARELAENGVPATPYTTLAEAFSDALSAAEREGKTLVCLGSLYTYGEIIKIAN